MKTRKTTSPISSPRPSTLPAATQPNRITAAEPVDATAALLRKVQVLLDAGQTEQAFNLLKPVTTDPVLKNARGVCLLRKGQPKHALLVYREICLTAGGISLRADVPTAWKTNYATTLLMQDNISGAQSILHEINDAGHREVRKLHAAIGAWRAGLSFWQRFQWALGHQPRRPFALDFPPGALQ